MVCQGGGGERMCVGGEGGIRTHERLAALVVFKTTALVHYATPPSYSDVRLRVV